MGKKLLSVNEQTGVETVWHDDPDNDGGVIIEKKWDDETALELAQKMRNETHGQRWGEGRHVGYISAAVMGKMMVEGRWNPEGIKEYLKSNPQFVTFEKYLK